MPPTHRSAGTAIALFVAVLACVLLLLLRGDAEVGANGDVEPAANARPTADTASASPASRSATNTDASATETTRTELTPSPQPLLKVRLSGLHPDAPWTASIRLDWEARDEPAKTRLEHLDRQVPVDGLATFALPDWVRTATQPKIRIDARDPQYTLLRIRLDDAPSLESEFVVEVMVRAVLTGRVEDGRGAPVEAARVVAFAREGTMPRDGLVGTTNTRADGTFTLQTPHSLPLFVVAVPLQTMRLSGRPIVTDGGSVPDNGVARMDLLPVGLATAGVVGRPTALRTLVAADASRITGTVRRADGSPVAGTIEALPLGGTTLDVGNDVHLQVLADGTVAPVVRTKVQLAEGSFELPAVSGARTTIAVREVEGVSAVGPPRTQDVVPPAHVDFVLPDGLLVRVVQRGSPVSGARVETRALASERAPLRLFTNNDGTVRILGDSRLRLRAQHDALASAFVDADPSFDREVVLELTQALTPVSIEFEGGHRVRNAMFRLVRRDGPDIVEHGIRDDRSGPFVCHVEPGHYVLHVDRAGGERTGVFLLPQVRELDVGTSPVDVRLRAQFGGRLTVVAMDARGVHLPGTCRVRGPDGRDLEGRFFVNGASGPTFGIPGELLAGGRNGFEPLLPPGHYSVLLDLGNRGSVAREFDVVPFGNHDVLVRMP